MSAAPGRRALTGYLVADVVSLVGTRVSMIAIPWLVLTTTGSATRTGLVAFAEMLPLVLVKAGAGPLIDRVGARRISIGCDLASTLVVGLIPVLHGLGALGFGTLLALVALGGTLRGPGDGAKSAFLPALAERAGTPLERVTGMAGAVERSASFVGAAAAGALVAGLGNANALYVDAGSFLVCAVVFAWSTRGSEPAREEVVRDTSYAQELREGWRFLRHDPVLVGLSTMVALTNLLDQASTSVLVPVWVRHASYGVAVVGVYFATWSAASVGGSVLAAWLGNRIPRFRTYVLAFLLAGLPRFLVLAFGLPLPLVLAYNVIGGVASGFLNPILGAVIFERIPPGLRGRVSTLNSALCWSLMPFGGLLGGVLVSGAGISPALVVIGIAYFAATMLPLVRPSFRDFDQRPVVLPAPAGR